MPLIILIAAAIIAGLAYFVSDLMWLALMAPFAVAVAAVFLLIRNDRKWVDMERSIQSDNEQSRRASDREKSARRPIDGHNDFNADRH